ncbi:MAG: DUF3347 domain-containing protein [Cyclobacteriaceae bacterium]
MKTQLLMIAALFVALGSVNAQHDHGDNQKEGKNMNHSLHEGMKMKTGQVISFDVSLEFRQQLTAVYNTSLKMTDSFVAGQRENVSNNSSEVKAALGKVDMSLLKTSEAHMDWMMNLKKMNTALDEISLSNDLKAQRVAYASFNESLFKSLKAFGPTAGTVYYQHCPMALDNKGGFWLSDSKEVKNPYFGNSMLTCGSTKETIN